MCGVCAICRFQVVEVMVTCVRAKRYDGSSRKIPYPTFADYLRTYLPTYPITSTYPRCPSVSLVMMDGT